MQVLLADKAALKQAIHEREAELTGLRTLVSECQVGEVPLALWLWFQGVGGGGRRQHWDGIRPLGPGP